MDGDYVNGTPLPPRQEGVSFFSNNVTKGQFQPIYFAFDSFEIAPDEGNKLRQIGSFLKTSHNKISFWPGSLMKEAHRNTIAGSENAALRPHGIFCCHKEFRPVESRRSVLDRKCPQIRDMTNPRGQKIVGLKLASSVERRIQTPVFPFFLCLLGV